MYRIELKEAYPAHPSFNICEVFPTIPCAKPQTTALAKPVKPNCREDWAFREIQGTEIAPYTPGFYWFHEIDGKTYIAFENLIKDFASPCTAVFKIGNRPYDLRATEEKKGKVNQKAQQSLTSSLSFRLQSLQTQKNKQVVETITPKDALTYDESTVSNKIKTFLGDEFDAFSKSIQEIISAFQEMVNRFPAFRAYNISLFVAYDGDAPGTLIVKLVHLNHTYIDIGKELLQNFYDKQYEDGCISGLKALAKAAGVSIEGNEEEGGDFNDYDE